MSFLKYLGFCFVVISLWLQTKYKVLVWGLSGREEDIYIGYLLGFSGPKHLPVKYPRMMPHAAKCMAEWYASASVDQRRRHDEKIAASLAKG